MYTCTHAQVHKAIRREQVYMYTCTHAQVHKAIRSKEGGGRREEGGKGGRKGRDRDF